MGVCNKDCIREELQKNLKDKSCMLAYPMPKLMQPDVTLTVWILSMHNHLFQMLAQDTRRLPIEINSNGMVLQRRQLAIVGIVYCLFFRNNRY
jgi:hypothetical protein